MCVTLTQVIIVRCQALQKEALAIMGHKTTVCKYTHIFTLNKKATLFVGIGLFSALSAVWTRLAVFPSMYVFFITFLSVLISAQASRSCRASSLFCFFAAEVAQWTAVVLFPGMTGRVTSYSQWVTCTLRCTRRHMSPDTKDNS